MSRVRRFVAGAITGYLNLAVTALVCPWLVRLFLGSLGQAPYGLWLLGTQIAVYASLLEMGIARYLCDEIVGGPVRDGYGIGVVRWRG